MRLFRTRLAPDTKSETPGTSPASSLSPPLDNHLLASLRKTHPLHTLRQQDVLFADQGRVDNVYIIVEGTLSLIAAHDRTSHIFHLSPGNVVGLLGQAQSDDMVYTATAPTGAKVLTLSTEQFDALPSTTQTQLRHEMQSSLATLFTDHMAHSAHLAHAHDSLLAQIAHVNTQRQAAVNAAFIQDEISNIPKIPFHVHELLHQLNSPKSSVGDIKDIVEKDTALTGMILKTVNSPLYGLTRKIASIHHAIAYLGFDTIYQVIVHDALENFDPHKTISHHVQYHSMLIAFIARHISLTATKHKNLNPTTIGLLHDVGKMVILLLQKNHPRMQEMFELLDDAALGASLLRSWDLPENIVDVVQHQYLPDLYPPDRLPVSNIHDVAVLYIAHVCHDLLMGKDISDKIHLQDYVTHLHIPLPNVQELHKQVIIPALIRNIQTFPKSLRDALGQRLAKT